MISVGIYFFRGIGLARAAPSPSHPNQARVDFSVFARVYYCHSFQSHQPLFVHFTNKTASQFLTTMDGYVIGDVVSGYSGRKPANTSIVSMQQSSASYKVVWRESR